MGIARGVPPSYPLPQTWLPPSQVDRTLHTVVIFSLYLPAQVLMGTLRLRPSSVNSHKTSKMCNNGLGSFVLGATDCNTQLKAMPGNVGPEIGAMIALETKSVQIPSRTLFHSLA